MFIVYISFCNSHVMKLNVFSLITKSQNDCETSTKHLKAPPYKLKYHTVQTRTICRNSTVHLNYWCDVMWSLYANYILTLTLFFLKRTLTFSIRLTRKKQSGIGLNVNMNCVIGGLSNSALASQ